MSKKLLGGAIIATGLLTGCSKSHTESTEYGIKKSEITVIEDSINQDLFKTINKKSKNHKINKP